MRLISSVRFHTDKTREYLIYKINHLFRALNGELPKVRSIEETILHIIEKKASICRFGDGELCIIKGESIEFQNYDPQLALRLCDILLTSNPQIFICIPPVFDSMNGLTKEAQTFWKFYQNKKFYIWKQYLNTRREYYNAFVTRPYMAYRDKTHSSILFNNIREIWKEKNVLLVEGYESRIGVGNDLLNNVKSLKRILCPSENGYKVYKQILDNLINEDKTHLVLIALGPTATVLAYDLSLKGFQALDIGHIDIEYEWFLRKSLRKIKIPLKYTNEAEGGKENLDFSDAHYESQILLRI